MFLLRYLFWYWHIYCSFLKIVCTIYIFLFFFYLPLLYLKWVFLSTAYSCILWFYSFIQSLFLNFCVWTTYISCNCWYVLIYVYPLIINFLFILFCILLVSLSCLLFEYLNIFYFNVLCFLLYLFVQFFLVLLYGFYYILIRFYSILRINVLWIQVECRKLSPYKFPLLFLLDIVSYALPLHTMKTLSDIVTIFAISQQTYFK